MLATSAGFCLVSIHSNAPNRITTFWSPDPRHIAMHSGRHKFFSVRISIVEIAHGLTISVIPYTRMATKGGRPPVSQTGKLQSRKRPSASRCCHARSCLTVALVGLQSRVLSQRAHDLLVPMTVVTTILARRIRCSEASENFRTVTGYYIRSPCFSLEPRAIFIGSGKTSYFRAVDM